MTLRVVVVGAGGSFGALLVKALDREPGVTPILTGRRRRALIALQRDLVGPAEIAVIDRERVTGAALKAFAADVVVDAAGPFQDGPDQLIRAVLSTGVHYLDLADARAFVTGIRRFDDAAKAAGVAVLSGASTTPALTHAVIDQLTAG